MYNDYVCVWYVCGMCVVCVCGMCVWFVCVVCVCGVCLVCVWCVCVMRLCFDIPVTVVTLKRLCARVFAVVSRQLIAPGEPPLTALP